MVGTDPQLISVIMPCHNASSFVEEAITSVLTQTYPHIELIVVDDGSNDDSPLIVEQLVNKHPGRIKSFTQPQSGPYPARNRGLQKASGAFVAFLDADDWWQKDCLEKLLTALQTKQADLSYCGWQNVGKQMHDSEPYVPPAYEEQDSVAAFLKSCPWPIHAALVRHSIIDAVEGFSERCFSSMDYDLWLRILGHTQNIVRVPDVLAYYRWHGSGQISAKKGQQVLDAVQVRRDFIDAFPALVNHLSSDALYDLVDGQLMKEAYRAYWRRDLINAQELFRTALAQSAWSRKDLRYILIALLPSKLFQGIIGLTNGS